LKKEDLLTTWKEIASYLDRDVRTCRRWEKKYGLPVHRMEGTAKSSIFAYKDELDKWLRKRLNEKYTPRHIFSRKAKWHKSLYLLFFIIGIAVLIISFILIRASTPVSPADFKIEESELIILNAKGKELWRYDTGIENIVEEKLYREHFQFKRNREDGPGTRDLPHIIIKDINNDNTSEVLFSTQTQNEFNEGLLFCFDHKGNHMWKFEVGNEMKFGPKVYSQDYRIHGFEVCDLDNDGKLEIIVISPQNPYFPTQLVILNAEGKLLGEYWNSGRLADIDFVDLDEDGRKEIIVVGMNNEYKKGCLVVFDSTLIKGSSPQKDNFYKCSELEPGSEKLYVLFPRTDVDKIEYLVEAIITVDILKNNRLSLLTQMSRILYELNYKLQLQDVRFSHKFEQMHKKARREGKIKSELNDEYKRNIEKGLLYYDGENWSSKRAISNPWK